MKRVIAFVLVMVVLLTLCATALAARPTVSLYTADRIKYARPGGSVVWHYVLRCGSYYRVGNYWRSRFRTEITRAYTNTMYGYKDIVFTNNFYYTLGWNIPRYVPTGLYYNYFTTFFRNFNSNTWYYSKIYKYYLRLY